MILYLMRHAEAVELMDGRVRCDADRHLTDKGRRQANRMGLLLKHLDVRIDRVFASPLARALETAEVVVDSAGWHVKIKTLDALKPGARTEAMWTALRDTGGESVLAVGHLPSIATLAGSLLDCPNDQSLWYHKSTLAALHCECANGHKPLVRLEWMISPGMAKRLAGK